jgi:hypothetical protein
MNAEKLNEMEKNLKEREAELPQKQELLEIKKIERKRKRFKAKREPNTK